MESRIWPGPEGSGEGMRRRDFIKVVGGTVAWPVTARGQQPAKPVVGFLHTGTAVDHKNFVAGFLRGLKDAGYTEGQNVTGRFQARGEGRLRSDCRSSRRLAPALGCLEAELTVQNI